jgi:hypothetical protein
MHPRRERFNRTFLLKRLEIMLHRERHGVEAKLKVELPRWISLKKFDGQKDLQQGKIPLSHALGVLDLWKARISMSSGPLADLTVQRLPLHVAMLAIACIPSKSKKCTRRFVDGYEYLRRGRAPHDRIVRKIPPSKRGTGENDAPPRPVCGPRLMDTTRPPSASPGHSSFRQNLRLAPPHRGVQIK